MLKHISPVVVPIIPNEIPVITVPSCNNKTALTLFAIDKSFLFRNVIKKAPIKISEPYINFLNAYYAFSFSSVVESLAVSLETSVVSSFTTSSVFFFADPALRVFLAGSAVVAASTDLP